MVRTLFLTLATGAVASSPLLAQERVDGRIVVTPGQERTIEARPPAGAPTPSPTPTPAPQLEPTVVPAPRVPTASEVAQQDREFLASEQQPETVEPTPPRAAPVESGEPLLEGGRYESAEPRDQAELFRRVESILRRQGLLDDEEGASEDGMLEEALIRYQSGEGLPITGRLDDRTLAAMRLLPPPERTPWQEREYRQERQVEVFRGRAPRSSSEPPPRAVRGIILD